MLDLLLTTHKRDVQRFFFITAGIYVALIVTLTPMLLVAMSGMLYLDDYISQNQIRSMYLFAATVLLSLFMVSSLVAGSVLTLRAKGNVSLRYLYFMLFFGVLAGASTASVVLFLILNAIIPFFFQ